MKKRTLFILGIVLCTLCTKAQIVPYLQIPTAESIIVNWRSAAGTESIVYYGEEKDKLTQTVTGTAELFTATKDNNYSYVFHTVRLNGLKSNTLYYYQIENNNVKSSIYSFKTQPAPGEQGIYRFIILGDHQLTDGRYERLMNAAKRIAEQKYGSPIEKYINIITNVGDQVNEGSLKQYDLVHFKTSEILSPNLPIATIVGNHETRGDNTPLDLFKKHYFNDEYQYKGIKSNSEFYYAMQQGRALFLMLSSEHTGATQKKWAQQVLEVAKTDTEIDWIISYNHRPIQAEQYVGDVSAWVRDEIMPLLNATGKSVMNVAGHHHLYHRGQLRDYPTYHIISGGASWDQRWGQSTEKDFDDVQKTIDYWPFQLVELDSEKKSMSVETYIIGNEVETLANPMLVDSFSRTFGKAKPNKPVLTALASSEIVLPFTFESSAYSSTTEYACNSVQFQVASDINFTNLEFDLIKDYEDIYGAHSSGALLVDLNKNVDIFKQTIANNQLFNGAHFIRVRHRDRNLEWSDWSESVQFSTKGGIDGSPVLMLNKPKYQPSESIEVTYNHALNQAGQWIGLYTQNKVPGSTEKSVKWVSAAGISGSTTFTLDNPGVYFAAIFRDGGYTIQAQTKNFYVGKIPLLQMDKGELNSTEQVNFRFSNAPVLSKDWVGVYKEGQTPGFENSTSWKYVTTENATVTFNALPVGDYFISYFLQDGYYEPGERIYFQVVSPVINGDKSVPASKLKLSVVSNWKNKTIQICYPTNKCEQAKLYNPNGLVVKSVAFTNTVSLKTNNLTSGVYILRIGENAAKVLIK
jgi:hypothetical protein